MRKGKIIVEKYLGTCMYVHSLWICLSHSQWVDVSIYVYTCIILSISGLEVFKVCSKQFQLYFTMTITRVDQQFCL